jgi:hypothetical protein
MEKQMRITVVGAILIVVGTIVLAVVLAALFDKGNRGPEPGGAK